MHGFPYGRKLSCIIRLGPGAHPPVIPGTTHHRSVQNIVGHHPRAARPFITKNNSAPTRLPI
eukprot:1651189-Pyramimonas_sp.AAC.1